MGSAALPQSRWLAKKVARRVVAAGSLVSGTMVARRIVDHVIEPGSRIRALTYHRFGDERRDPFCVTPAAFEAQVRWLVERGLAVSLDDVEAFVAGRVTLPDGAALITIDDGCLSTLSEAAPILARHGVRAVAYVTPSLIGLGTLDALPEPYLSWTELSELAQVMDIGGHGFTHRSLGQLSVEEARDEARRSREMLEDKLSTSIRTFAYPFGTHGDFTPETERALADAGYTIAFNSQHGAIRPRMDPISLPRVKVEGGEGMTMFRLTCRGAMDPWRVIDSQLWRLQRHRKEVVPT